MPKRAWFALIACATILLAGCPKGNPEFEAGRRAETIGDYDTALVHYERALRANPTDAEYKLREMRMRSEDGQFHVDQGEKALQAGNLELAMAEFQKAAAIDPSNTAAQQEGDRTLQLIEAKRAASQPKPPPAPADENDENLLPSPPELKPLSREPLNYKGNNTCDDVFQTIAKLAGLSVIFDPDFNQQYGHTQISTDLPDVTLEQALDAVSLQCKAFWKPVTSTVVFVAQDTPDKHRQLDDEEVQTFYLSNTVAQNDITEIMQALRATVTTLRQVAQVNSQNAIVVRGTPDTLAVAGKIIHDLDQAKPEILLHVQVLSADLSRLRDLGILPGQSVSATFNPRSAISTSSSSSSGSSSIPQIAFSNLHKLSTADWSITLPGATANAILTDTKTEVIQDPEIRMTEGEKAALNIGEKIPYASGSFLGGGVGVSSVGVSSLVSTQFQQQDVGVIITVDNSRVHPNGDVSLLLTIEVSSIAGEQTIGGVQEPLISQKKLGPFQVRLANGESTVMGGLIERDTTNTLNGIPGVSQMPLLKYFTSDNSHQITDHEVLLVVTPHVVRFPSITAEDLRPLASGTEQEVRVYREAENPLPGARPPQSPAAAPQPSGTSGEQPNGQPPATAPAQLQFQPASVTLRPGDQTTVGIAVSNVSDLYSVPLLIRYNPAVIQVDEVRDGGFLSGGTQEIAIVQRIDPQRGEVIISATRQPNTPGVNGSGTLFGLVVRGVAPGNASLQIAEITAKNSQQQVIPLTPGEAKIQVR